MALLKINEGELYEIYIEMFMAYEVFSMASSPSSPLYIKFALENIRFLNRVLQRYLRFL